MRLAYTPAPRVINPLVGPPLPMFTGVALSTNNMGAGAQAEVQATFRMAGPNKNGKPTYSKVDDSFARLDKAPVGAKPRNASPWEAGALVLDPWTFSAHNGDFIDTYPVCGS